MAAVSIEAQPRDEAAHVRELFEQGQPFALGQPLLPLLLLTEMGQDWCENGLGVFFRRLLRQRTLGSIVATFSLTQWDGPVCLWACSLARPGTNAMSSVSYARMCLRGGRDAFLTLKNVAKAAGVSPWVSGLDLAQRLDAAWPSNRRPPPRDEVVVLGRLLGVEIPP